jgi:hypothetical protein
VILSAKFVDSAWITVLVIPLVTAMLKAIKRHYELIDRQLRDEGPIYLSGLEPPIVLLPLERWDRLAEKAVRFALLLSHDVVAIHLTQLEGPDAEQHEEILRRQWRGDVAVVLVPWSYEPPHPQEVIEEEEPGSGEPAMAAPQGACCA